MSFRILSGPKVAKMTHALARRFFELPPCEGDRQIREVRIKALEKQIKEGTFRAPEWASALCLEDKITYRVNGKHTSTIFSTMTDLPDLHVIVTEFECDSKRDVAELYSTFDSKISARTSGDVIRSFQMSHESLCNMPSTAVRHAVSAISFALWELSYQHHPADERAALMFENVDFIFFLSELINCKDASRLLGRTGCASAIWKTWKKSQSDCRTFWIAVRDGTGHPATVPDRKLNRFLLSTSVCSGHGASSRKEKADTMTFLHKCIHAWNAWRTGSQTDLKYHPKSKTPVVK